MSYTKRHLEEVQELNSNTLRLNRLLASYRQQFELGINEEWEQGVIAGLERAIKCIEESEAL